MKIKIKENCSYNTVLDILKYELKLPSSIITFLKKKDRGIVLNGERVTVRKTIKVGDLLELEYTDEKTAVEESNILPVKLPLDIIYEDNDVIAVNKPPYMPTHPSHNHYDDTMLPAPPRTWKKNWQEWQAWTSWWMTPGTQMQRRVWVTGNSCYRCSKMPIGKSPAITG